MTRRTGSLRGRVVLAVLTMLTLLLVGLFVAVDLALSARLRSDLRTRLTDRIALAEQLDGDLQPQQLVDRLQGDGVQAELCSAPAATTSATCVSPNLAPPGPRPARPGARTPGGRAPAPRAPKATIVQTGSTLFVRTSLPHSGQLLSLSVDGSEVTATVRRLVGYEIVGGLLSLLLAAVLLGRVVAVALRPLDQMTTLARRTAGGDRGRRLGAGRRDTELGRTATAFDAMLDELESALDSAEQAQAGLRQFLGDASHELRSPLAGVQASAELLLRREPGRAERERTYVALIRETRRAGRLVDDLLTIARFDEGTATLASAPLDLAEVAEHEVARLQLRDPGLDVHLHASSAVPVAGDPLRLGQIMANLLDNARQATATGGRVDIDVTADGRTAQLEVRDTGPGVPPGERERIFQRLVRLDSSRSRDTGGFGLGLPIARSLARAHGGELTCAPCSSGAVFRLTLPLRADAGTVPVQPSPSQVSSATVPGISV
jgi:two-component system OmpR family sensor kinase